MKFATKAIHVGYEPESLYGAVMPPIYMTSTFEQEAPGQTRGYDYTRGGNPNFTFLENILASLEEAKFATVFSSGIGALTALVSTLKPGDIVIGINGVYGGTYRLFNRIFKNYDIHLETISPDQIPELDEIMKKKKPKWLFFETPTNPLLDVFDIEMLAKLAKKHGILSVVDNTFASPYCQNPLLLGVDIVWHSTTKYIGGHSDVIGGVVMTNDPELKKDLNFRRLTLGVNPSPFDTWLITRGVKTLAVRMEQHQKNAFAVANFLEKHPKVKKVYYPGLPSHPHHEIAKKQMRGFSGMVSAEFNLELEQAKKLLSTFKLFTLAESLGGVESLVNHPSTMTHLSIPPEVRKEMGIADGLIRFSIGIEDPEDIIADLDQALK